MYCGQWTVMLDKRVMRCHVERHEIEVIDVRTVAEDFINKELDKLEMALNPNSRNPRRTIQRQRHMGPQRRPWSSKRGDDGNIVCDFTERHSGDTYQLTFGAEQWALLVQDGYLEVKS